MEQKRKLKLIPIWQFFKAMQPLDKVLISVLFLALLATCVGALLATNNPSRWVVEVSEVSESSLEEVTLRSYTQNYRTMGTTIGAWKENVAYYASMFAPKEWMVIVFLLAQILGWAYLLAASTYLRNLLAYAIVFAFAILIFVSNLYGKQDGGMGWLINIGLTVAVLAPVWLLQQEILKLKFVLRLLIFMVVAALPFGLLYYQGGWIQLHGATVGMMPVLVVMAGIYLLFIATDISNLMFYLATNAKNPKYRVRFPIIFSVFLVITAIEFLMMQREMGWQMLVEGDDLSLRPMHLIVFAALISVGTKQNLSPKIKQYVSNERFSMSIVAFGVIALSFVAYQVAMGEYLFLHIVERLASILFFLAGIFHFFYIFYNFGPLIRHRVNFYFLSMMPRKLMFFFVIIATLGGALAFEASAGAASQRMLNSTTYDRFGDHAMLKGNKKEALLQFRTSNDFANGNVKSNYNYAMLMIGQKDYDNARKHFKMSCDYIPFPYSYLNWSNLEERTLSPKSAHDVIMRANKRVQNPYLSNNQARFFLGLQEPDSAILEMKEALRLMPNNGAFYANMGRIYLDNGKPDEAKKFFEAGLKLEPIHPAVVTNALFLNLRTDVSIDLPEDLLQKPGMKDHWETTFNFAIDRYKKGEFAEAQKLLARGNEGKNPFTDSTISQSLRIDSLLLDGMLLFERGDIDLAISRMDYIDMNYPEFRPFTNHFLGVAFFGIGSPEMAASFFRKSAENGRADDILAESQMQFDRGNLEYAMMQLKMARDRDSTLIGATIVEEAKIQYAFGEYFFASLGFNAGELTVNDWIQIGIAAGRNGNKWAALEAFRRAIDEDPENIAPYLEMAKISLRLGDSLALENLQPALNLEPKNLSLNVVHAKILLKQGNVAAATKIVNELVAKAPTDRSVRTVNAEWAAAKGDTTKAIELLEQLRKENPIDPDVVLPLSHIYRAKRLDFEGQNMMMAAKDMNPENPDFWYEIAHFERLLNRPEEAGAAAEEAMAKAVSLEQSKRISAEFKEEIAIFRQERPIEEE